MMIISSNELQKKRKITLSNSSFPGKRVEYIGYFVVVRELVVDTGGQSEVELALGGTHRSVDSVLLHQVQY